MAVYCSTIDYCVSNTGYPAYDDVYTNTGVYNLKTYYQGITNGYYIFFSNDGYWCLSDTLGGTCFLSGKYPCGDICPDLMSTYLSDSICPTPTPTPTVGCGVFNFEAVFVAGVTPTPSITPTLTRTPTNTPTPSHTNYCPLIYVDASVVYTSPTPTPTPTSTPGLSVTKSKAPVIQCNFSGDVTFVTVDTIISCPVSKQFQDCSNGFMYYTTNVITNPSGGDVTQFMIFEASVDGQSKCITYLGTNSNVIGSNNITLRTGPIGYSNLGGCSLCTVSVTPTPTPTPTMTMTPSSGISVKLCDMLFISQSNIYKIDLLNYTTTQLPFTNTSYWSDIAHTQTKVFISTNTNIKEWNITLSPFSSTYVRNLSLSSIPNFTLGSGLYAINDSTLISCNVKLGLIPQPIVSITLPSSASTNVSSSNITNLFTLPNDRQFVGDLIVTSTNKLIITTNGGGDTYISQYSYPDGNLEVDILTSPTVINPMSIFVNDGALYIMDINGTVYTIDSSYPYTITPYFGFALSSQGTSQILSCVNTQFEFIPVTYYVYKRCGDTGIQNYIYQTESLNITIIGRSFLNTDDTTCWSYQGTSTTVPTSTTDNIVNYTGNYFSQISNTIYTNCSECISLTECNPPSNLTSYPFGYGYTFNNGPINSWPQSANEICDIVYSLRSDLVAGNISVWSTPSQPVLLESLEIGSYVYLNQANCNCYGDGFYYINSFVLNLYVIVEISNCVIVNLWPCNPSEGTSPTNPNGGGTGGTGTGGGSTGTGGTPGGTSPIGGNSQCECTAVRTISGFQGTAFFTDCRGNNSQIIVPGGSGFDAVACFCRRSGTPVLGAVTIEPCQTTQSSGGNQVITNNCLSQITCN